MVQNGEVAMKDIFGWVPYFLAILGISVGIPAAFGVTGLWGLILGPGLLFVAVALLPET